MSDTAEETTEKKSNPTGAKVLSKIAMFIGGLWVLVGTVLKGLSVIDLTEWEIILGGLGCVFVWVPAYASIYLDKIKELKEISQ